MKKGAPTLEKKLQWLLEDLKPYQPEKIILFGSAARGDADAYSYLDVVIIKRTRQGFVQRGIEAARLVRSEIAPIDLLVYTPEEFRRMLKDGNPFIEKVFTEGKVLYEKAA